MKKFFEKLGFHKMDEMEQLIAFKAQRNAFVFLLLSLFVWTLYEAYTTLVFKTELNPFPCFLLAGASSVQFISEAVISHNAVKGDEDSPKASALSKKVLLFAAVLAVTMVVANIIIILMVIE